jgi:hypothetical protein
MGTEEQKKKNLLKVFNIAMYGMVNGLWDLFGESSFATINSIGDKILSALEQDAGLEIAGETPEDILLEVVRLLVDEVGTMSDGSVKMDGKKVSIACQECFLRQATGWLESEGVQPFACVPMNISAAAMRKRLGTRHRVVGRQWDAETQTCTIEFELVH